MLDVDDVSRSYHGVPAVRMVSLRASPGQVIGLLGANGSGTSTTVRMLVGMLPTLAGDRGTARVPSAATGTT